MDEVVRVCVIEADGIFNLPKDIKPGVPYHEKIAFTGGIGRYMGLIWDLLYFIDKNLTVSLHVKNSFGSGDDGCLASISKNESDFAVALYDYPYDQDYEKVYPLSILYEEPVVIFQGYNTTSRINFVDIFRKTLQSFSLSLWLLLLNTLIVISLIMKIGYNYRKKLDLRCKHPLTTRLSRFTQHKKENHYPFYETFSLFMGQNGSEFNTLFGQIISLIISLASFVLIFGYICNLMATDMVVVDKPITLNTYEDVINRPGMIPLFFRELTDYQHFKNGMPGSVERRLWDVSTKERASESRVLIVADVKNALSLLADGSQGKTLLFVTRLAATPLQISLCKMKYSYGMLEGILVWYAIDPSASWYQKVIVVRNYNSRIINQGKIFFMRFNEFGFHLQIRMNSGGNTVLPPEFVGPHEVSPDDMRECTSENVLILESGLNSAKLRNFSLLSQACFSLLSITAVILILEIIVYRFNTRKSRDQFRYSFRSQSGKGYKIQLQINSVKLRLLSIKSLRHRRILKQMKTLKEMYDDNLMTEITLKHNPRTGIRLETTLHGLSLSNKEHITDIVNIFNSFPQNVRDSLVRQDFLKQVHYNVQFYGT